MSRGRPSSYHDPAFLNQDPYAEASLPTTREFYGSSMEQSQDGGLPLFNSHTMPPSQAYPPAQRNSISLASPPMHQYSTPDPPTSHAGGFVARSASLGGARKRDPFAHRADDVESGLGFSEMDSYGISQSPAYARGRAPESFAHPPPPPSFGAPPTRNPSGPRAVSQSYAQSPSQNQPSAGSMPPPPLPHQRSYGSPSPSSPYNNTGGPRVRQSSSSQIPQYGGGQHSAAMSPASSSGWLGSEASYPPSSQRRASAVASGGRQSATLSPEVRPTSSTSQPPPSRLAYPTSQPSTPVKSSDDGRQQSHNGSSKASTSGFRSVKDLKDLKPVVNAQPVGRRADSDSAGKFLSPLKCLTAALPQTYNICNPNFAYESTLNPRRVLTKPSKAEHNEGYDNEDYDYILYVNDILGGADGGDKYLILDVLGQGTFGQVVKCQNMRTHDIVAVKVVKNKPAYLNQSKMEVAILDLLNNEWDKHDEHHILRMNESFTHRKHLCLVFECLSSNLYELIKQNQFRGLSTQLVKVFTQQLLDALQVLKEARLIHCDLKPENILLKSLQSPQIKVIDFGSACHEMQTVYTYIQSRFYRSPEVLLGLPYSTAIDMWSLGCIVVELFLGLPLFPGTSEYNQLSRIVDMLGTPPTHLLEVGKQTHEFFNCVGIDASGRKAYRLKPMEQYASEHRTQEQPSKQYFKASKLKDIIMDYPVSKKSTKPADVEKEMTNRTAFVNFVEGLLNLDPIKRWSPQQASKHPFITGEKYTGPYEPHRQPTPAKKYSPPPVASSEKRGSEKRYGGLVGSPAAKGARAYQDAAAYNHQLAQHQSYTAQVQNANQYRHPFAPGAYDDPQSSSYASQSHSQPPPPQTHLAAAKAQAQAHAAAQAQAQAQAHAQAAARSQRGPPMATHQRLPSQSSSAYSGMGIGGVTTNPPPNSYYPASRNRANTINQMDSIPPALARLTNLGAPDPAGIRSSLTPILNRDEAIREWERRYAGPPNHQKRASMQQTSYPQLEFLQEQAELAAQGWMHQQPSLHQQYAPPHGYVGPSGHRHSHSGTIPAHQYHMQPELSSAGSRSRVGPDYDSAPPSATASQQRFMPAFPPPAATTSAGPAPAFDSFDPRGDSNMALLYTPLQPQSAYQPPMSASASYAGGGGHGASGGRHSMSGNFFYPQPPSAGRQGVNNPFSGQQQQQHSPTHPSNGQKRSSFGSGFGAGSA